ncbi:hypothetical protein JNB11_08690 [Kocuria palustris]|nr:hypothetical protein [Kocuria palustris]
MDRLGVRLLLLTADVPPLDPRFDRSHLRDDQYIECLLDEIQSLRRAVSQRDEVISQLRESIGQSNNSKAPELVVDDVPIRLAGRRRASRSESQPRELNEHPYRLSATSTALKHAESLVLDDLDLEQVKLNPSVGLLVFLPTIPTELQFEQRGDATHPTLKQLTLTNLVSSYKLRIRLPYTLQNRLGDDWRRLQGEGNRSNVDLSRGSLEPPKLPLLEPQLRQLLTSLISEEDGDLTPKQQFASLPHSASTAHISPIPSLGIDVIEQAESPQREAVRQRLAEPPSIVGFNRNSLPSLKLPALANFPLDAGAGRRTSQQLTPQAPNTPEAFGRRQNRDLLADELNLVNSPLSFQPNMGPESLRTPTLSLFNTKLQGLFHVLSLPQPEQDAELLLIKPDDFHTIYLNVVLTYLVNRDNHITLPLLKRRDDINFTVAVTDRDSDKEMWRIRKLYTQAMQFDSEIRPIVEVFGLPILPDKNLFLLNQPSKVDQRRQQLQDYFNSLFTFPHIPQMILFKICRFLSLDFVNPLDDHKSGARKEGYLLRRYKGLGLNWRIRWCQVDGPMLEIYDYPGAPLSESIKLTGAQIGRQNLDQVADDKGYRHAFLIMESRANTRMSNLPKHFFCAETDEERDEWVDALLEFNEPDDKLQSPKLEVAPVNEDTPPPAYSEDVDTLNLKSLRSRDPRDTSVDSIGTSYVGYSDKESLTLYLTTLGPVEDEPIIQKKKKKSIFPFSRYLTSSGPDEVQVPPALPYQSNTPIVQPSSQINGQSSIPQAPPMQSNSMQQYIEQLNQEDGNAIARIFGGELSDAYKLLKREVFGRFTPAIIARSIEYLIKVGALYEEGIFRLSGLALCIRQLKDQFNLHFDVDFATCEPRPDMHTVALLLKTYLRELPAPILGLQCFNHLNGIVLHNPNISPLQLALQFRDYFNDTNNVDEVHYNTCYVIFRFLQLVISHSQHNRMNLRNVCIVFVPTLNVTLEVLLTFLIDFACIFEGAAPVPDHSREILDVNIPNFPNR